MLPVDSRYFLGQVLGLEWPLLTLTLLLHPLKPPSKPVVALFRVVF
jgi:hypothetical protein